MLSETDGSLGAHLRRLEEAGYLRVRKQFVDRKPVSWYALTTAGRQALERHVGALERLLSGLATAREATTASSKRRPR